MNTFFIYAHTLLLSSGNHSPCKKKLYMFHLKQASHKPVTIYVLIYKMTLEKYVNFQTSHLYYESCTYVMYFMRTVIRHSYKYEEDVSFLANKVTSYLFTTFESLFFFKKKGLHIIMHTLAPLIHIFFVCA